MGITSVQPAAPDIRVPQGSVTDAITKIRDLMHYDENRALAIQKEKAGIHATEAQAGAQEALTAATRDETSTKQADRASELQGFQQRLDDPNTVALLASSLSGGKGAQATPEAQTKAAQMVQAAREQISRNQKPSDPMLMNLLRVQTATQQKAMGLPNELSAEDRAANAQRLAEQEIQGRLEAARIDAGSRKYVADSSAAVALQSNVTELIKAGVKVKPYDLLAVDRANKQLAVDEAKIRNKMDELRVARERQKTSPPDPMGLYGSETAKLESDLNALSADQELHKQELAIAQAKAAERQSTTELLSTFAGWETGKDGKPVQPPGAATKNQGPLDSALADLGLSNFTVAGGGGSPAPGLPGAPGEPGAPSEPQSVTPVGLDASQRSTLVRTLQLRSGATSPELRNTATESLLQLVKSAGYENTTNPDAMPNWRDFIRTELPGNDTDTLQLKRALMSVFNELENPR